MSGDFVKQLRDYRYWIGKSPAFIREAAIQCGGWASVFADGVPQWAHLVRNYFNETPSQLKRLGRLNGTIESFRVNRFAGVELDPRKIKVDLFATMALNGQAYEDTGGRTWFAMDKAGTAYHYDGDVTLGKKVKGVVFPQSMIPVFKLISPDGTGGSLEVCVENEQNFLMLLDKRVSLPGKDAIGRPGDWVDVDTRIVKTLEYQGTYNYSETVIMGFKAHELRDMKPHEGVRRTYVNPPAGQRFDVRTFPERDGEGRPVLEPQHAGSACAIGRPASW